MQMLDVALPKQYQQMSLLFPEDDDDKTNVFWCYAGIFYTFAEN